MPEVGRKAPDEEHTQSVCFYKDAGWTESSSREWCEEQGYYTDGLDETESLFRWRQYDPEDNKFRYRNQVIEEDSIFLVIGFPIEEEEGGSQENNMEPQTIPQTRIRREPIRCFEGSAKPYEPFWQIRNAEETESGEAEVELYGYLSEYSWLDDEITPAKFKDDLYRAGNKGPVTIRINSGGGDIIAASVMRTIIKDYPGRVTVKVDGLAASAAVVVALAGDKIYIQDTAYMMIHDPGYAVFLAWLDIETLERLTGTLKSVKQGILDTYSARTGITVERLSRMMSDETWMSANEAVKLGFADEVIGSERVAVSNQALQNALKNYVNVPAVLLNVQPEPVQSIDPEVKRLRDEAKLLRRGV